MHLNPSIAYKATDKLSIGASVNLQYFKAKRSSAVDCGTLDTLGKLGPPPGALHLMLQLSDGFVKLEGDSWGGGYNFGVLYEFTKNKHMGIACRSRIKQTLEGDDEFSNVPTGLAPVSVFKNSGIKTDITVTDSLSVSVFHNLTPTMKIMAFFTRTDWGLFKELRVRFDNPNQRDSVTAGNWLDIYRYSMGLIYVHDPKWTFRIGVAYDTSAVPNAEYRTPRIQDSNRRWIVAGIGYKVSQAVSFNVGYAHIFIPNLSPTQASIRSPQETIQY